MVGLSVLLTKQETFDAGNIFEQHMQLHNIYLFLLLKACTLLIRRDDNMLGATNSRKLLRLLRMQNQFKQIEELWRRIRDLKMPR